MPRPFACSPLLLALFLSTSPHAALAQSPADDAERASALFKKGKEAYLQSHLDEAYRLDSEAWKLRQSPDIAANLAQAESDLHLARAAADHFAFALDHLLPSTTEEQKQALTEGLELQKKQIGTLHLTLEPSDIAVVIDGVPATPRANGDIYVEPGQHDCTFTREGYQTSEQRVQISKGGAQVMWIKLNPLGAAPSEGAAVPNGAAPTTDQPPADSGAAHGRSLVPAFVGGGIAVVGLAAGVGFMLSGNSHRDKARDISAGLPGDNACGAGTTYTDCSRLSSENSAGATARRLEVVSLAVAGAAAVGTAIYLLWPHGERASAGLSRKSAVARLTPDFGFGPSTGTVSLSGSF